MKRKLIRALCAAIIAAIVCSPMCLAAKQPFGAQLSVDAAPYSEEGLRAQMEAEKENALLLAANSQTGYRIIYAKVAGDRVRAAARFLADALTEMTGAKFQAMDDTAAPVETEIRIGNTNRNTPGVGASAGAEAYRIVTQGKALCIQGADEAATVYGVYGFMEDVLHCVFLNAEENFIPHYPVIRLAQMDQTYAPKLAWRNIYAFETTQNNWFERLRLNGICRDASAQTGVNQYAGWGTWCHSYLAFVPPETYFDTHPEYYAMKDGVRIKQDPKTEQQTQLCLTNPDVLRIVKENMRVQMEQNPDQLYWDFSVMDSSNVRGCECDACKKLDEAAGSGMGSLLPFINALAEEFPDKMISTLAYFHTVTPPQNGLKARENVVIKLCAMPGSQGSPYAEGGTPNAKQFQEALRGWFEVCGKIVVWDYVVDFSHLVLPFPNFAVQQANQAFYEENGVIGVFHQASRERGGEMADMRAWVLAKLMWDGAGTDVNALVSRYIAAAYGDAAPQIAAYLNLMAEQYHASQIDLGLYDAPQVHKRGYLSKKNIAQYQALFAKAEEMVAKNPVLLTRVRQAKLPVLYAKMMETSVDAKGKKAAAEEFFRLCDAYGVEKIHEVNLTAEELKLQYAGMVQEMNVRLIGVPAGVTAGVLFMFSAAALVLLLTKKKKLGDVLVQYDPAKPDTADVPDGVTAEKE